MLLEQDKGVHLEPISHFFAIQKGLNGPKSCIVGQSITMLYWWGPLGTIWEHLGPF